MLSNDVVDEQVLSVYHEVNTADLKTQMQLLRLKSVFKPVGEAANIFREMVPEVRGEYDELRSWYAY